MESDLCTSLDWVAVAHWNTDNPHVDLLVRGVADDGSDLVITRLHQPWPALAGDRPGLGRARPQVRA
jgi:hypothetical protein